MSEKTENAKAEENWKERAVGLRVLFYVLGTHLLAAFMWLLFYVGEHAHK